MKSAFWSTRCSDYTILNFLVVFFFFNILLLCCSLSFWSSCFYFLFSLLFFSFSLFFLLSLFTPLFSPLLPTKLLAALEHCSHALALCRTLFISHLSHHSSSLSSILYFRLPLSSAMGVFDVPTEICLQICFTDSFEERSQHDGRAGWMHPKTPQWRIWRPGQVRGLLVRSGMYPKIDLTSNFCRF